MVHGPIHGGSRDGSYGLVQCARGAGVDLGILLSVRWGVLFVIMGCIFLVSKGACINDLNVVFTVTFLRRTIRVCRLTAFLI